MAAKKKKTLRDEAAEKAHQNLLKIEAMVDQFGAQIEAQKALHKSMKLEARGLRQAIAETLYHQADADGSATAPNDGRKSGPESTSKTT